MQLADQAIVQQYGSFSQIALMQAPACASLVQPVVSGVPLVQTSWSQRTGPASSPVPASSPPVLVPPKQLGAGELTGVGRGSSGDAVQVAPEPSGNEPENVATGVCRSNSVH